MATVQMRKLGKTYPGGVVAATDVSIDIADGEFIVLVGPSGCGKSTILRMVAGLETITQGELAIDGRVVNRLEPGARDIAMVFQNYALYPHMTVRRNMDYGLRNEGLPKTEIEARLAEAARMLRLEDYLDRKPRQLSGGQRQRVAMGRAIVRKPKVFLLDEPLSNLDAKLRTELRGELKALHDRLQATFIYVTHDQVEAMSLADRIIVMSAGRVEQIGTPMELYLKPETRFVADFIGSPAMNMFEGSLSGDGTSLLTRSGARIDFTASLAAGGGGEVAVGIRPEHLSPVRDGGAQLSLEVGLTERLGADTLVHGTLAGSDQALTLRLSGVYEHHRGDVIEVGYKTEDLHLFDAADGRRLN